MLILAQKGANMNKLILNILLLSLAISCGSGLKLKPITNFEGNVIPDDIKISQVRKAILRGGATKGWIVKKAKSKNEYTATINVRKHRVDVSIPYSKDSFSINYKDSENMNYNEEKKLIHRNYFRWVVNLRKEINKELLLISANAK